MQGIWDGDEEVQHHYKGYFLGMDDLLKMIQCLSRSTQQEAAQDRDPSQVFRMFLAKSGVYSLSFADSANRVTYTSSVVIA